MNGSPKSWVGVLLARKGYLLGGSFKVVSSRFEARFQAANWLEVMLEGNNAAGRHAVGRLEARRLDPQIMISETHPEKPWDGQEEYNSEDPITLY
jgi:hypothetical protein